MRDDTIVSCPNRSLEFVDAAVGALRDQELEAAISLGARRIAHQLREIESLTSEIQATIADRVKARLLDLLQQEMRRTFARPSSDIPEAFLKSGLREALAKKAAPEAVPHVTLEPEEAAPEPRDWRFGPTSQIGERSDGLPSLQLVTEQAAGPAGPAVAVAVAGPVTVAASGPVAVAAAGPVAVAAAGPVAVAAAGPVAVAQAVAVANAASKAQSDSTDEEVYEGSVRLDVETSGCIKQVVDFVDELRQRPQFRLFQLAGQKERANILLGLREPLPLRKMLREMPGVSQVVVPQGRARGGCEHLLNVRLAAGSVAH